MEGTNSDGSETCILPPGDNPIAVNKYYYYYYSPVYQG
jgi:hypothetical protein